MLNFFAHSAVPLCCVLLALAPIFVNKVVGQRYGWDGHEVLVYKAANMGWAFFGLHSLFAEKSIISSLAMLLPITYFLNQNFECVYFVQASQIVQIALFSRHHVFILVWGFISCYLSNRRAYLPNWMPYIQVLQQFRLKNCFKLLFSIEICALLIVLTIFCSLLRRSQMGIVPSAQLLLVTEVTCCKPLLKGFCKTCSSPNLWLYVSKRASLFPH